jgi:arabinofuranan 3-O-arabinosyltransferase
MPMLDRWFEDLFRRFGASTEWDRRALTVFLGLTFGCAAAVVVFFEDHYWIIGGDGKPMVCDFVAFWAAGRQALNGMAQAAYNIHLQHAAEVAAVGHSFNVGLGWSYPPLFLFAAAALATLPYVPAFLLWCAATLALHAGVVGRIAERPNATLVALTAPWTLLCLWVGQNGLLTAALVGLALLFLERRPLLCGLMLGLLSYKPQFGVLFPFALAAGGYWRAFGWAALSVLALNGLAAAVFGFGTVAGFVHALGEVSQSHLNGGLEWRKLQSLYGLLRSLGGGSAFAMVAQLCAALGLSIAVILVWRKPVPYSLKAATLSVGLVLATPYVFAYDLPILAIAIAYLRRERPFDRAELTMLAISAPLVFAFLFVPFPAALGASAIIGAMVVRRLISFKTGSATASE